MELEVNFVYRLVKRSWTFERRWTTRKCPHGWRSNLEALVPFLLLKQGKIPTLGLTSLPSDCLLALKLGDRLVQWVRSAVLKFDDESRCCRRDIPSAVKIPAIPQIDNGRNLKYNCSTSVRAFSNPMRGIKRSCSDLDSPEVATTNSCYSLRSDESITTVNLASSPQERKVSSSREDTSVSLLGYGQCSRVRNTTGDYNWWVHNNQQVKKKQIIGINFAVATGHAQ